MQRVGRASLLSAEPRGPPGRAGVGRWTLLQAALQGQKPLGDTSLRCHRHRELAWGLGTEVTANRGGRGWCHHCTSLSFPPDRTKGMAQSWTGSDQEATTRCKISLAAPQGFPVKPSWCQQLIRAALDHMTQPHSRAVLYQSLESQRWGRAAHSPPPPPSMLCPEGWQDPHPEPEVQTPGEKVRTHRAFLNKSLNKSNELR